MRWPGRQFVDEHGFVIDTIQVANGFVNLPPPTKLQRSIDRAEDVVRALPRTVPNLLKSAGVQAGRRIAITSSNLIARLLAWMHRVLIKLRFDSTTVTSILPRL